MKKNKKGRLVHTTTGHKKFCILLDLLEHEKPSLGRNDLLSLALSRVRDQWMNKSWQEMHNDMIKLGIQGYDPLSLKNEKDSFEIDF